MTSKQDRSEGVGPIEKMADLLRQKADAEWQAHPSNRACKDCGAALVGDGYGDVVHCETLDLIGEGHAPDSAPIHCGHATVEFEGRTLPVVDWNELSRRGVLVRINEMLQAEGLAVMRVVETGTSPGAMVLEVSDVRG